MYYISCDRIPILYLKIRISVSVFSCFLRKARVYRLSLFGGEKEYTMFFSPLLRQVDDLTLGAPPLLLKNWVVTWSKNRFLYRSWNFRISYVENVKTWKRSLFLFFALLFLFMCAVFQKVNLNYFSGSTFILFPVLMEKSCFSINQVRFELWFK